MLNSKCFKNGLKNGHPISKKKSPLETPNLPFCNSEKPLWCSKKLGSMIVMLLRINMKVNMKERKKKPPYHTNF